MIDGLAEEVGLLLRLVWAFRLLLVWSLGSSSSRFDFGFVFVLVCGRMEVVEAAPSLAGVLLMLA